MKAMPYMNFPGMPVPVLLAVITAGRFTMSSFGQVLSTAVVLSSSHGGRYLIVFHFSQTMPLSYAGVF
jgi:hypothetical protein